MRLESTFSQRHQLVECRDEAGHRDVGHRRLSEALCVGVDIHHWLFSDDGAVCVPSSFRTTRPASFHAGLDRLPLSCRSCGKTGSESSSGSAERRAR